MRTHVLKILMLVVIFLPLPALSVFYENDNDADRAEYEVILAFANDTVSVLKKSPMPNLEIKNFGKVEKTEWRDGSFDLNLKKSRRNQIKSYGTTNRTLSTNQASRKKTMVTWNGSQNNNWNNSQNWDDQLIPTVNDNVSIPGGLENYPIISDGNSGNCNDFTVEQGSSFTIEHGGSFINLGSIYSDGEIDILQTIPGGEWHMISIPNDETIAGLFLGNYLQYFDASTAYWTDIVDPSTELIPLRGYAFFGIEDTATFMYSGTPNHGNLSHEIAVSGEFNNLNLLGNPYPSALDWNLVAADQTAIHKAVYCWNPNMGDAGVYETYVNGLGDCRYIFPQQGFFVSAVVNGDFTLSNDHRAHINNIKNAHNREIPDHALSLGLYENDKLMDKIFFRFNAEATSGFDGDYDAHKILVNSGPQFSIKAGENILTIDQRPICEEVQLGFYSDDEEIYSIALAEESNDLQIIFLHDTKTGIYHNLRENDVIFMWYDYDDVNRFKLNFGNVVDNFSSTSTSICEQEFVTFFADTINAFADSVFWHFEGGTPETATGLQPTIDYNTPGNFDVTMTAYWNNQTNTIEKPAFINVTPNPEIPEKPFGEELLCFDVSAASYTTNSENVIWELDPSSAGTMNFYDSTCNIIWNVNFSGDAVLKVKSLNICGESEFSEPKSINRTSNISIGFEEDILVCYGERKMIEPQISGGIPPYSFSWEPANIFDDPTSGTPIILPNTDTEIALTLTDNMNCITTQNVLVMVDGEDYELEITAFPTQFISQPFYVQFDNLTPDQENFDFIWYFGNGDSSLLAQPNYTYNENSLYSVTLIATSKLTNCTDTLFMEDMIACTGAGIGDIENNPFSYALDETGQQLKINFENQPGNLRFQLFDLQGKSLYSNTIHQKEFNVPLPGLSEGMYIFVIKNSVGVFTGKFVIVR